MKLIKGLIAAATVALATPAVADLSDILSSGTIKVGVPENFPPFGSLGIEGEYEGYDVDVAKLIAADLGVELELVPVTSKQRIPFLETDKVDLVISSMVQTQNGQNRSGFRQPMRRFIPALLRLQK